jgi:phosphonoacetaldehyde hydrolase
VILASDTPERGRCRGPVTHLVLDWAGTLVDFGSLAPTRIFVEAFGAFGVPITLEQARGPMGVSKIDHIRALGALPEVRAAWWSVHGHAFSEDDAQAVYRRFLPMQQEVAADFSAPIPGAFEAVAALRARGLKVGTCSGYPQAVMDRVLARAARDGFVPDHCVASDTLPQGGRPQPFMALANAIALGASHVAACVKADDTTPGIEEGRRAGMWTVGVALSGNEAGWTLDEYERASSAERARRRAFACARLFGAGAHYVIDTLAELPEVVATIDLRLARGETP